MKSILTLIFLTCTSIVFALNITVNPAMAPCGTTTINGNTGCTHNGTLQISVAGNPTGISISDITPITGGNFTFKVTVNPTAPAAAMLNITIITSDDPTGCALPNATGSVNMNFLCSCNLQVNVNSTNESCFGCNNGVASAAVTGSADPVTYNWSNGSSGNQIMNLVPGTYAVTATDANGCNAVASFNVAPYVCTIFNVQANVTDVMCHNDCNGSIQLGSLSNGSSAFSVVWNEGQNSTFLGDLCAATYYVTVTDNDNCTASAAFQVTQPPFVEIIIDSIVHATGMSGGQAFLTINSGGIELTNCELRCTCICFCGICGDIVNNAMSVNNLEPAFYTLNMEDSNGCEYTSDTFEIQNLSSTDNFFSKDAVKIFPNPAADFVRIQYVNSTIINEITIARADGVIVNKLNFTDQLDVTHLTSGIYFLSMHAESGILTLPLTIVR